MRSAGRPAAPRPRAGLGDLTAATRARDRRSYKLTSADVSHDILLIVTAVDTEGQSTTATATPVGPVQPPPPPVNTTRPVISGITRDGQTITSTQGTWTSADTLTYHYQWQRCGNTGAACKNITGATASSYKLTSADVSHDILLIVTAVDTEGQSTTATATPVGPVQK